MYEYDKLELKVHMDGLKRAFGVVRIVDPIKNIVPFTIGMDKIPVEGTCYDFWKNGGVCDNCIAIRAIEEDRVITKIEYNDKAAFLVIASPIVVDNNKYAIETLLDIKEIDTIRDLNKENSKQVQGVITNLKENLLIDELTGVYNRRFINKNLPVDIDGKSIGIDTIAVIMVDIDDFKEINDIYGHLVGDYVLKEIATIINSRIRKDSDWVARYGGDEFIILLRNADEVVANNVTKAIQKEIDNTNFIESDPDVKITLSFGIHIIESGTMDYEKVLKIIDNNLNRAKCSGKNKAVIS